MELLPWICWTVAISLVRTEFEPPFPVSDVPPSVLGLRDLASGWPGRDWARMGSGGKGFEAAEHFRLVAIPVSRGTVELGVGVVGVVERPRVSG